MPDWIVSAREKYLNRESSEIIANKLDHNSPLPIITSAKKRSQRSLGKGKSQMTLETAIDAVRRGTRNRKPPERFGM